MLVDTNVTFFSQRPSQGGGLGEGKQNKIYSPPCLIAQRQVVQKHSARESKCSNGTWAETPRSHKTQKQDTHINTHRKTLLLRLLDWTDRDTTTNHGYIQGATKVNETSERNTPADNTCVCVCVCAQPNKTTHRLQSLFLFRRA